MRRVLLRLVPVLLLAVCLMFGIIQPGRADGRKLTLMIYMCGSNLENDYGSASGDIAEMIKAKVDKSVTILLMAGGSKSWRLGYREDRCTLVEVSARGQRKVYEGDQMNMGTPEALTTLLTYGQENYPAEDYALILWDHGGGPVEGVCWDEQYRMDHLSLAELTAGLETARLEKKLKWIGFDACLMGSLEVASVLAPYAEYMIASQETEPAFGWNYSFLKGIEADATGGDTGRRIVEAYFEDHEDYSDIMTLSCLDLSRIPDTLEEIDRFFSSSRLTMNQETFQALSGMRSNVTAFGKAVRALGEDGYDLVDARGLFAGLSAGTPEGEKLAEALDRLVVCSKSNETGADGVSLYHPFANKQKYREKWKDEYETLHFSGGYTQYIRDFGTVLLGGVLTDWSGLPDIVAELKGGGQEEFTLQLTPEQAEGVSSAQLLILSDFNTEEELRDDCTLLYAGDATIQADGTLAGVYTGKNLYIEREDGSLFGPVSFYRTQDGEFIWIRMSYMPEGISDPDQFTQVVYYLDPQEETEYPEIQRTRVWDRATESFTNRIEFDETQYAAMILTETGKKLPQADERELLPAFEAWEDGVRLHLRDINLPNRWRFRWMDEQLTGKQLYATFQVTDIQQNVFCVPPVPVRNPWLQAFSGTPENNGSSSFRIGIDAVRIHSPMKKEVRFQISVENPEGIAAEFTFSPLTLNGERVSSRAPTSWRTDGSTPSEKLLFSMETDELYGLERIETAKMTVQVQAGSVRTVIPVSVRFESFETAALWEDCEPLAETEKDGVIFRLLSLETYDRNDLEAKVLIVNGTKETLRPESSAVIDGFQLSGRAPEEVPPQRSRLSRWILDNTLSVAGYELETYDDNPYFYLTSISDGLLRHRGITEISALTFFARFGGHEAFSAVFPLELPQALPLLEGKASTYMNMSMVFTDPEEWTREDTEWPVLAECSQYTVRCGKILMGKTGAALQLEITNRSDHPLEIQAKSAKINGIPTEGNTVFVDGPLVTAPKATTQTALVITSGEMEEPPAQLESLGFRIVVFEHPEGETENDECTLTFREARALGLTEAVWLGPDQVAVEAAHPADLNFDPPRTANELLSDQILLTDHAVSYQHWVPANLTTEQEENTETGVMFLVRYHNEGATAEVISYHKMIRGEDGHFGSRCSGLLLCPRIDPDIAVPTFQGWPDESHVDLLPPFLLEAYSEEVNLRESADDIKIRVDFENNSAEIADITRSGKGKGLTYVRVWAFIKRTPPEGTDPLPPLLSWDTVGYYHTVALEGEPMELMIRPITGNDQLYAVFSVTEKDGTEYSLPPVPYEPENP